MDYKSLGERIRSQRRLRGLTQEQLAERAGISFAFVGHIERGTRKLSVATLIALARALDCSVDYLLDHHCTKSDAYLLALQHIMDLIQGELQSPTAEN